MTANNDNIRLFEEIVRIWETYLEFAHGQLALIFITGIPESLLPFPKDILLKVFGVMESHFNKVGDQLKCKLMREYAAIVYGNYKDDEKAPLQAASNINNPKWLEVFIPNFKEFQERLIRTQDDYMRLVNRTEPP